MQNKTCILFTLLFLLSSSLFAQAEDYLLGSFINNETQLGLTVTRREDLVYEGKVKFQGVDYPYEGIRLLGTLQAEYAYQGNNIPFSLELNSSKYYFTSEGVTLEMQRTSAKAENNTTPVASKPVSATTPSAPRSTGNAAPATGTLVKDPYGAFTFNAATGWTAGEASGYITLTKAGDQNQFNVCSHNYASREAIKADAFGIDNDDQEIHLKATTESFGDNGIIVTWTGTREGQPFMIEAVSLCSPYGGGVCFIGSGTTSPAFYTAAHSELLRSMAKTVKFTKPVISADAQQWITSLRSKQLVYLQTSNGGTEREDIDLCADGTFAYKFESSYTSGGYADFSYAGNDVQEGTWKIVSRGPSSILILYFGSTRVREFTIVKSSTAGEVLLNSKRYFIQGAKRCN